MLGNVTSNDFQKLLGNAFTFTDGNGTAWEFTLTEVDLLASGPHPGAQRDPFSLIFKGPDGAMFSQGTLPLQHPEFGKEPLPIFIVPIGKDPENENALIYQAIFS